MNTQFATSNNLPQSRDSLGNLVQGTWSPLGQVLDKTSADSLFERLKGEKAADAFEVIWQGIWDFSTENWQSKPFKIKTESRKAFLSAFGDEAVSVSEKGSMLDTALGWWDLESERGYFQIEKDNEGRFTLSHYFRNDETGIFGNSYFSLKKQRSWKESANTLAVDREPETFTFISLHGKTLKIKAYVANGLGNLSALESNGVIQYAKYVEKSELK